jgi:hypothetical protein
MKQIVQSSILLLFFFFSFTVNAGKIEKGFERLALYDYFDAKVYFEKASKRHTSAASYGLAMIYFRQDNPFHSIDSAYNRIRLSERSFKDVKSKKLEKWEEYGFSFEAIRSIKDRISRYLFERLEGSETVIAWTSFLEKNPDFSGYSRALFIRDSLAFDYVLDLNSALGFKAFMESYPESEFLPEAQNQFYKSEYLETTRKEKLDDYQQFLIHHPTSPYINQAQDEIYNLVTNDNTIEVLEEFVRLYPTNRNLQECWRRLYQVFMYEYSEDRIGQFQKQFPKYPFMEELKVDLAMSKQRLVPMILGDKFGAIGLDGEWLIKPTYDMLGFFNEGLAVINLNGKFGFINKAGKITIPLEYDYASDFESGRAVIQKGEGIGLIDRSEKIILEPIYEDIGMFSEGLIYAQFNEKYGYFDRFGELRIPMIFDEAFSFKDGMARVEINNKQSFINTQGDYLIDPIYDEVSFFTKDLIVVDSAGLKGIINLKGKYVVKPTYDEIGELSYGLAIVSSDDQLGYIDSLGELIISLEFDVFPNSMELGQFRPFSALAKYQGKFGLIDRYGKFVVPNVYSKLGEFSTILAFNKGKLWGFIDLNNKVLIPSKYDWAESFKNGGAIVDKEGAQGVINMAGEVIIPIEQEEILRLDPSRYQVKRKGQAGIYGADGGLLVPVEYQEIRQLNKDFYVLSKGELFDYLYLPENRIIKLKN